MNTFIRTIVPANAYGQGIDVALYLIAYSGIISAIIIGIWYMLATKKDSTIPKKTMVLVSAILMTIGTTISCILAYVHVNDDTISISEPTQLVDTKALETEETKQTCELYDACTIVTLENMPTYVYDEDIAIFQFMTPFNEHIEIMLPIDNVPHEDDMIPSKPYVLTELNEEQRIHTYESFMESFTP